MNRNYKYGSSPYINQFSTRPSTSSKEVVATSISTNLVTKVLNESLTNNIVNIIENFNLEEIIGSLENISVSSLSPIDNLIRFTGGTRFESNFLIGSSTDTFNTDYSFEVNGNSRISGTNLVIESEQVLIRDNCIGIGNSSSSLDNFINGIYFPKNDQFTGIGISPDKIGIISFPYGQFSNNFTYTTSSSSKRRFSDNKTNVRFVYISDSYDFGIVKDSTTGFSSDEQNYINSLNNIDNISSSYYTNIEVNNIVLHGGGIVSGLSQNLEIILTNSANVESTFMTFDIINDMINIPKSLQLSNIVFNNQTNFGIYYQDTSTPVIYIDKNSTTDSTTLNSSLIVKGTNVKDYPSFSIENNLLTNIISTEHKPSVKKYIQNKIIDASDASGIFTLEDITSSDYIDLIISGYIIFTCIDSLSDKYLHLKIEGSINSTNKNIIETDISYNDLSLNNIDICYDSNVSNKKIDIIIITSYNVRVLICVDIIST